MSATADIREGQCLCGTIRFRATLPGESVQLCHCKQCQRWTGGGALAVIRATDIDMSGTEAIQSYQASGHGERAFCRTCGSTLYWKLQGRDVAFLPAGLFEDQAGFAVGEEIFVDQRAPWMQAFEGASQQEEAEMHAQLAAFLEKDG